MNSKCMVLSGREKYILRITDQKNAVEAIISPLKSNTGLVLLDLSGGYRAAPIIGGKCLIGDFRADRLAAAAITEGNRIIAKGELFKTDWNRLTIMLLGNERTKPIEPREEIMNSPEPEKTISINIPKGEPAPRDPMPLSSQQCFQSGLFDALAKKWPNSKWEKIDYPGCPERFYITGEIYGDNGVTAVCYAVPSVSALPFMNSSNFFEVEEGGCWLVFSYPDGSYYDDLTE